MWFPDHLFNAARWILSVPMLRHLAATLFIAFAATLAVAAQTTKSPVLTVGVVEPPSGPFASGNAFTIHFVVTNPGPGVAENILIKSIPFNVTLQAMQGACKTQPCVIRILREGERADIDVPASIARGGDFAASLGAEVRGPDSRIHPTTPVVATFRGYAESSAAGGQVVVPAVNPQSGTKTQNGDKVPNSNGIRGPGLDGTKGPTGSGSLDDTPSDVPAGSGGKSHKCKPVFMSKCSGAQISGPGGFVPAPLPIWIWPAAAMGVFCIVVSSIGMYRTWWRGRIGVSALLAEGVSIDTGASLAGSGSLRFAAPSIHVRASLAPALAVPPTQFPILRKEILHD